MYRPVTLRPDQARVIRRTRELLADPGAVIPDSLKDSYTDGRVFLAGYLQGQLGDLLAVAEELAGIEDGH